MSYKKEIRLGDVVDVTITNKSTTVTTVISGEVDSVAVGLNGPDSRKITIVGLGGYIYLDDNVEIAKVD
jgi:hypothetical protein